MKIIKGILYWVWSLTWGGIMTWIGAIVAFALLITGHKPHRFYYNIYFNVGENWGGLNLGAFFFTDREDWESTKRHEAGHGLQNLILGPIHPFIVAIPSAFRYWFREMNGETGKTVYAWVTSLVTLVLGAPMIVCGVMFNLMWLWIVGAVWCTYFFGVCCIWQACEIPKYNKVPQPFYNSVWFEEQASRWGEKCFPVDTNKK